MLEVLLEIAKKAVEKLPEMVRNIINGKREKIQAIAKHLNDIAECLTKIEEKLNDEKPITEERASLNTYTSQLSRTLKGMDENMIKDLTQTLKNIPEDIFKEDVKEIRTARGKLTACVNTITNTGNLQSNGGENRRKIGRKSFFLGVTHLGALTAGWWAGRRQNPTLAVFDFDFSQKVEWNMESALGTNQSTESILYDVPKKIITRVNELTNGKFIINLPDGDTDNSVNITAKAESILKKVHDGDINCGYIGIYYEQKRYRPLYFASSIPFGLTPQQQTAWLLYKKNPDDKLTYVQTIYEQLKLNIIPFPSGGTGTQMGGWFNKEIKSLEDLKGLRMRIPGLGAEVLAKLGVENDRELFGELISPTDIVTYLQQPRLDAAEWIGPHDDFKLGLHTVAKYYYYPGWWEPSTTLDLLVNKDAYDKLPDSYKYILQAVCWETYLETIAEYDRTNSKALTEITNYGTELRQFPDDILKEAKQKTEELLTERSNDNPDFKKVYEEWKKFKEEIQNWHKYTQI